MHFWPQRPPNEPDLSGQPFDKFRHSKELVKLLKRARTTDLTNIGGEQRRSRKRGRGGGATGGMFDYGEKVGLGAGKFAILR